MSHRAQYEVSLCNATQEVGVTYAGAQAPSASTQGGPWEIQRLGPAEYLLRRPGQGRAHRIFVDLDGEIPQVCTQGRSERVNVISARDSALARAQGQGAGASNGRLSSPMPGRVVSVLVEPGQSVKAGQPVIIVEAMKMENELAAPLDGDVQSIEVSPDQAVDAGQTLCVIAAPQG